MMPKYTWRKRTKNPFESLDDCIEIKLITFSGDIRLEKFSFPSRRERLNKSAFIVLVRLAASLLTRISARERKRVDAHTVKKKK